MALQLESGKIELTHQECTLLARGIAEFEARGYGCIEPGRPITMTDLVFVQMYQAIVDEDVDYLRTFVDVIDEELASRR